MNWNELLRQIEPPDSFAMAGAKDRWDSIAKPLHGLGRLEDMIVRIAGIMGTMDVDLSRKGVLVFCADNGVVAEGVSQTDSGVTAAVAENIARGRGNINAMANAAGAEVFAIDIGIEKKLSVKNLREEKIAPGTKNFTREPAMTRDEAERAIETGIRLVKEKKEEGFQILATGEMGIGNTTTSSAVLSVLLDLPVSQVTGRGAGLSDSGLRQKREVIERAIALHHPDKSDPVDVLSKVGGLDIAGMTGVFLGGALYRVPIVIDGLISAAAALLAKQLCPAAVDFMLASHLSREIAAKPLFDRLGLLPVLHGDFALGEGTGAVMLFPLLDMTLAVYRQNTTFAAMQIPSYTPFREEQL